MVFHGQFHGVSFSGSGNVVGVFVEVGLNQCVRWATAPALSQL